MINIVFGHEWLMGEKLTNIIGTAANTVWPQDLFNAIITSCSSFSSYCFGCTIGSNTLNDFYTCFIPSATGSLSGTECAAAVLVGIFFLILTLTFLSYFLSLVSVGETLMFTIFRNKSDEDNILDRKDEEELELEAEENEEELQDSSENDSNRDQGEIED